jgi:hypothetical protein
MWLVNDASCSYLNIIKTGSFCYTSNYALFILTVAGENASIGCRTAV